MIDVSQVLNSPLHRGLNQRCYCVVPTLKHYKSVRAYFIRTFCIGHEEIGKCALCKICENKDFSDPYFPV